MSTIAEQHEILCIRHRRLVLAAAEQIRAGLDEAERIEARGIPEEVRPIFDHWRQALAMLGKGTVDIVAGLDALIGDE